MIIAAFLTLLAVPILAVWFGQRSARIDRDVRGVEICVESDRSEQGLYGRWWIA